MAAALGADDRSALARASADALNDKEEFKQYASGTGERIEDPGPTAAIPRLEVQAMRCIHDPAAPAADSDAVVKARKELLERGVASKSLPPCEAGTAKDGHGKPTLLVRVSGSILRNKNQLDVLMPAGDVDAAEQRAAKGAGAGTPKNTAGRTQTERDRATAGSRLKLRKFAQAVVNAFNGKRASAPKGTAVDRGQVPPAWTFAAGAQTRSGKPKGTADKEAKRAGLRLVNLIEVYAKGYLAEQDSQAHVVPKALTPSCAGKQPNGMDHIKNVTCGEMTRDNVLVKHWVCFVDLFCLKLALMLIP